MIRHFPRDDCCCRAGLTVCGVPDQTCERGCEKDAVLLFFSFEVCFALEGREITVSLLAMSVTCRSDRVWRRNDTGWRR